MPAHIKNTIGNDLAVEHCGYQYRRVDGNWQMLSNDGNWFDCPPADPQVLKQVQDYEYCLRSYTFDEGRSYPRANKKGDVGAFFRDLQRKELTAGSKNIFAPVRLKYDATAENRRRVAREAAARLRKPFDRERLWNIHMEQKSAHAPRS